MKNAESNPDTAGRFLSNCVDIWIDEPGDTTVGPIAANLLEQGKAERAKYYPPLPPEPPVQCD